MTPALTRLAKPGPVPAAQAHTLAMWRAQQGALMILGNTSGPLPKTGSVRIATVASAPGVFRAEFWPLQNELGYAFLVAIRLPDRADRSDNAELVLRGARGVDRDLRLSLVAALGEPAFGKQVAAFAGAYAARIARFMLDVMRSDDVNHLHQPNAMLDAFLTHAARADGCVELIMHVPQKCVLLQGWGIRLNEPVELLLPGSSLLRHPARSGDFPRGDTTAPATGSVLALPPEAAEFMASLEKVFLLTGDDLLCRNVVEPRVLDVDASIGQIRHLLPRLNCPAPMQALLRATLQPHYEGRDTLNGAGRPVRAALDIAISSTGGGAYVSGWVFDPGCHTVELHLCAENFAARLDETWVRVPREDVSAAFRADPAFPSPLDHEFGFAVATSDAPPPDQPAYLRFTFTDGDAAFLPIRFIDCDAPSALSALLASVDLHKSSGLSIVARHLAPFIAQMPSPPGSSREILLHGPLERSRAIVVPLCAKTLPRSFVSSFLLDPAAVDEQIIFVCGPEWDYTRREALMGLIQFYELPASIIGVAHTPRSAYAVCEAAALSGAESFLLASPGVVGSMPGWREALYSEARTDHATCPTVLFEDRSVRFAGSQSVAFLDRAPFFSIHAPLAGAYADLAISREPTRTDSGTFACCLIQRSAIPVLARAARFMTEPGQEAAFFLALRDEGMSGTWVPSVRVSAPEDDLAHTSQVSPLIDGWILRQTWGEPSQCAF